MKKSELTDMIREIVKEEVATEMSNAFRFIMKEQFMNFSKNSTHIDEVSGRREDMEPYPTAKRPAAPSAPFDRTAFASNYKNMMDGRDGPSTAAIPATTISGRPIDVSKVDKVTLDAITKDYSSFMKTMKKQ